MSQAFEYVLASDMLSASSVILRCAVLYEEFKCQNHTVCRFVFVANIANTCYSQYVLFFYGSPFQCISLFCQQC